MSELRDKLVKLAFEQPELRKDILPLLKEAGSFEVRGEINPHQIILTVTFAGYGRMHDIVRGMKAAEKALGRHIDNVRQACLDANVLWRNQGDITFAPLPGPGRQMEGTIFWSVSNKMDPATMAELTEDLWTIKWTKS